MSDVAIACEECVVMMVVLTSRLIEEGVRFGGVHDAVEALPYPGGFVYQGMSSSQAFPVLFRD
jgi:hypothetical protein